MKNSFLIIFISILANISVAMADVRVNINWTGELRIDGFSSSPGFPANSDNDPSTITYQWTIDGGSSQDIKSNAASCGKPVVNGSVVLIDGLGPGVDENLDINALLNVATLLPPGVVNFPPGVTPVFTASGSPISTIPLEEAAINLNTILDVNQVTFNGSVLIFQTKENVLAGTTPASTLFTAEDVTKGNDGILTRPFTVDIILECTDSFIGQNGNTVISALQGSGFTVTSTTEVDTSVTPGTVIRIDQNPDGSLTVVVAGGAPVPPNVERIPSMSTLGLLLLTPLLGLIALFGRKKQH